MSIYSQNLQKGGRGHGRRDHSEIARAHPHAAPAGAHRAHGEKSIRDITVKELTQRADVNRGTFYSHYQDIYDMVRQLENELFEEFDGVLDAYPAPVSRDSVRP